MRARGVARRSLLNNVSPTKKRLPTLLSDPFVSRVVLSGGPVIPECLSPMVEFWNRAQQIAQQPCSPAVWPAG